MFPASDSFVANDPVSILIADVLIDCPASEFDKLLAKAELPCAPAFDILFTTVDVSTPIAVSTENPAIESLIADVKAVPPVVPAAPSVADNVAVSTPMLDVSNAYPASDPSRPFVNAVPPVAPALPSVAVNAAVSTPILDVSNAYPASDPSRPLVNAVPPA